ncbi:MAG: hypothetical protein UY87_C0083G0003 [Candidatus Peribacteria bacterium GW2011_GWC2_54_8]|nr:MAG: hypothetical protein UY87_C0083G0003 [Candidatus Peribacteria bacterium GW2011_GWC2_54_8]
METPDCSSLQDIQELLRTPPTEVPLHGRSREEKQEWMSLALKRFGDYATLSKEEKGIIRQYLQLMTGYSRAALTRNIRLALEGLEQESVQTQAHTRALWRTLSVYVLGPVCLILMLIALATEQRGAEQVPLAFLNAGAGEFATLHGAQGLPGRLVNVGEDGEVRPLQVRTVTTSTIGPAIAHPLFVATIDSQTRELQEVSQGEEVVFALDVQELIRRVEERRQKRLGGAVLQHILTRFHSGEAPHTAAPAMQEQKRTDEFFVDVYPLHASAPQKENPVLLELFGMGQEGQILMLKDGVPQWQDMPLREQIREAAPHGDERTRRGGGYRSGGGGGGDSSTTTSTTSTTNITNNYTTINQSGTGAVFVGTTTVTSYNGQFTSGSYVGYQAANAICDAEFSGSHFCQTDEIIGTISSEDISTLFSGIPDAWIAEGPPGYTADSNDCRGWTSSGATHLGPWWEFSTAGGGIGHLTNCSTTKPLACCR